MVVSEEMLLDQSLRDERGWVESVREIFSLGASVEVFSLGPRGG